MAFLRTLGLALAVSLVAAQTTCPTGQTTCGGDKCITDLQCSSCGFAASNTGCVAENATFDSLPAGSDVGVYDSALWTGFKVVALTYPSMPLPKELPGLLPASDPNYAATEAGDKTCGSLQFECENMAYMNGQLLSFDFGCTTTNTYFKLDGVPQACQLTVDALCEKTDGSGLETYSSLFSFTPTTIYGAPMEQVNFTQTTTPAGINAASCANYTFSAASLPTSGTEVVLALDNVIYNAQY